VLMTCVIAGVGLLPAAISTGIGSQVQKPLAVVVVGGMMLAPAVILITLPVLILLFSRRAARPAPQQAVPAPADEAQAACPQAPRAFRIARIPHALAARPGSAARGRVGLRPVAASLREAECAPRCIEGPNVVHSCRRRMASIGAIGHETATG